MILTHQHVIISKKFYQYIVILGFVLGTLSCKQEQHSQNDVLVGNEDRFRESYRPQYHFTPPEKWMNDPNGLLYHNGVYHLFYQYYPDDIVWGPMHWGHATSTDLVAWNHKPIALYPDELGYIFSGSAVMDTQNTSGLGTKDNPAIVAIFTYHDMAGEKAGHLDYQTQGIAYSLDEGDTWTKYEGNPVIGNPTSIKDFRDPKVMWHENTQKWIMSLVAGDHAKFYSSENLIDWELLSEFGRDSGAHGGVWECPDLFQLQVEGSEETKWVLLISINPGAPNGGSGTQYFVGDFDGKDFTTEQTEEKWIDYGTDNYAGVSYNGLAQDDRTFIGWMSNWNYARDTPTKNWRSAMTLSRKLTLKEIEGDYYLNSFPVSAINDYSKTVKNYDILVNGQSLSAPSLNQHRLDFKLTGELRDFKLTFSNAIQERLVLGYNRDAHQFYLDRTQSGLVDFEPRFAEQIHLAPAILKDDGEIPFSIFLDASSIELFIDGGTTVFTDQIFPTQPYMSIRLDGNVQFENVELHDVRRIWE